MSKGEQTRQRIIALAAPIFNQRGFDGCSIQAIMTATGLEKGGIYRHFESKEELAAEAFDYAWTFTSTKRRQDLDLIPDPVDRLKRHIANFIARTGLPGGCPLLNTGVDSDDGNPILRERVRQALCGWQSMLAAILQEGLASGAIQPQLDPVRTANRIIGALEGAMLLSRIEQSDQPLRHTLEDLDLWLESEIRNRPSQSARSTTTTTVRRKPRPSDDEPQLFQ
jgi:TetR/AcrR family transcriptional repressor of nem operon